MKDKDRFLSLYLEITKRNICVPPTIIERREIKPIEVYSFVENI